MTDDWGTVGGGYLNQAGDDAGTTSDAVAATVCGGVGNSAAGPSSAIGGGEVNSATSTASTVGGGSSNKASGDAATVPGGHLNLAGGVYSLAAGNQAKVRDGDSGSSYYSGDSDGDEGTFVWADSTNADFISTAPDQFLIRASGGVGIGTNVPSEQLDVGGNIHASGTITSGSSITIDGSSGSEKIVSSDALEIHTSTGRVLRITPEAESLVSTGVFAPNLLGGFQTNAVTADVVGATIAGGGATGFPNRVTDDWGTVSGGLGNVAGDDAGTTGDANYATVGGGLNNTASDVYATVGGGLDNRASAINSTVGGGVDNTASGSSSTVPGGRDNLAGGAYSFAAGNQAKVRDGDSGSPYYSGDSTGDEGTFVWADSTAADFISTGPDQFLIRATGGVGINTNAPDSSRSLTISGGTLLQGELKVERDGTQVVLDRLTTDGIHIRFRRDGTNVGSISVDGGIVSYNDFTGSHLGWTDQSLARGTLVRMTGSNQVSSNLPDAEIVYGITRSSTPNDPRCMGAYLGLLEPDQPASLENPHQIMAVGNGKMWVVETDRGIEPGDYLISSGVRGHAMLDDPGRFPVGYVVARAAEPVDWSEVAETVDGRKHKKISVFFESFERGSSVVAGKLIERQSGEIEKLHSRIEALEREESRSVMRAGLPLLLIGLIGLAALPRRNAKGGA